MPRKSTPISEPFQVKKRATIDDVRAKRWPGMRFATASLYPVSKDDMVPQYERSMEYNPDLEVLIKGNDPGAREFIGPTLVLLGEPMEGWEQKQAEWVSADQEEKAGQQRVSDAMTQERIEGESMTPDEYASSMRQDDQID